MQQYLYKATCVAFFIIFFTKTGNSQQVRLIGNNGMVMASKNLINNTAVFENIPPNGEYKLALWVSDSKKCIIQKQDCLSYPNKVNYCKFSGHIVWSDTAGEFLETKSKNLASGNYVCYVERKNNTLLIQYYQ